MRSVHEAHIVRQGPLFLSLVPLEDIKIALDSLLVFLVLLNTFVRKVLLITNLGLMIVLWVIIARIALDLLPNIHVLLGRTTTERSVIA